MVAPARPLTRHETKLLDIAQNLFVKLDPECNRLFSNGGMPLVFLCHSGILTPCPQLQLAGGLLFSGRPLGTFSARIDWRP